VTGAEDAPTIYAWVASGAGACVVAVVGFIARRMERHANARDARLDQHMERVDDALTRLALHDQALDGHAVRLEGVERRAEHIDGAVQALRLEHAANHAAYQRTPVASLIAPQAWRGGKT
jgi:Tfp pilus assembly protein PilN